MKTHLSSLVVACALAGCATHGVIKSKIYDMREGKVLDASFFWDGKGSGPTTIARDSETCSGEYRAIQGGTTSVGGSIGGTGARGWGAIFSTMFTASTVENAQRGTAVAICPSGLTFDCEFVTNVTLGGPSGHGVCKDNRGADYRLMF